METVEGVNLEHLPLDETMELEGVDVLIETHQGNRARVMLSDCITTYVIDANSGTPRVLRILRSEKKVPRLGTVVSGHIYWNDGELQFPVLRTFANAERGQLFYDQLKKIGEQMAIEVDLLIQPRKIQGHERFDDEK